MPDEKATPMEAVKSLFGIENLAKFGVLGIVVGLLYSAMDRNDEAAKTDRDTIKQMMADVRDDSKADNDRHYKQVEDAHAKAGKRWEIIREMRQAIADLTMEMRVYHGRAKERDLPKGAPKKMDD